MKSPVNEAGEQRDRDALSLSLALSPSLMHTRARAHARKLREHVHETASVHSHVFIKGFWLEALGHYSNNMTGRAEDMEKWQMRAGNNENKSWAKES